MMPSNCVVIVDSGVDTDSSYAHQQCHEQKGEIDCFLSQSCLSPRFVEFSQLNVGCPDAVFANNGCPDAVLACSNCFVFVDFGAKSDSDMLAALKQIYYFATCHSKASLCSNNIHANQ